VDIDLEKFFDQVNHQRLMSRLQQKVSDRRLLKLIGKMLKAKNRDARRRGGEQ
jgi:RNA-directed DNA polymerase